MIREDIARLYRLQEIDSAMGEREALLAGLDDGSAAQGELEAQQAKLESLQEQVHRRQAEQRDLELELEGVEEEARDKHDRAYGGTVSAPKELSALERKLEELERSKQRLEDKILGLLEEMEEGEAEVEAQQGLAEEAADRAREITTDYEQKTQRARNELEQLGAGREELVAEVEAGLLGLYEDLRRRLEGVAIVAVKGGVCTGCNVAIPRSTEVRGRRGEMIAKCESCRRMLFFDADSE